MPEARDVAAAFVSRAFESSGSSPALTVSLGRALLALGVANAASLIAQRAGNSPEPLRQMLGSLLTGRSV